MIIDALLFSLLLINMVMFHEFGHVMIAKRGRLGMDKKGVYTEYETTTKQDKKNVSFWGVLCGFVPILLCAGIYGYLSIIMLLLYGIGIKDDLQTLLH